MKKTDKIINVKRLLLYFIIGIFAFSLGFGAGYITPHLNKNAHDKLYVKSSGETETKEPEKEDDEINSLVALKHKLERETRNYEGDWSIYVENLGNGEKIEINNKKMRSASLIKLFIMGKVYEEIEAGTIKKEDVSNHLKNMITISDNESSNVLVSKLGGGEYQGMDEIFSEGLKAVNGFAKNLKCDDTEQQRDMKNSRPKPIPQENYTSAKDCGILLSKLYHKKLVSPESDGEMLELLKGQQRRTKIPAGLPPEAVCANKTGELSDTENDVAIVFSPGADYVICVLSNDLKDTNTARNNITRISEITYNFFNVKSHENSN